MTKHSKEEWQEWLDHSNNETIVSKLMELENLADMYEGSNEYNRSKVSKYESALSIIKNAMELSK